MYITFSPDDLDSLAVTEKRMAKGISIKVPTSEHEKVVYHGAERQVILERLRVLRRDLDAIARAEHKKKTGHDAKFSLREPDAWFAAIYMIMWQATLAGLTWDTIKPLLAKYLTYLKDQGVAPATGSQSKSRSNVQFHWSGYIKLGNLFKLHSTIKWHVESDKLRNDEDSEDVSEVKVKKKNKAVAKKAVKQAVRKHK